MNARHAVRGHANRGTLPIVILAGALMLCAPAYAQISAADARHGVIQCTNAHLNKHNPNLAENPDRVICFEAYVSNFNAKARRIGNRDRFLGVPHWVAHHIARAPSSPESGDRPGWSTISELAQQKIAPTDDSYSFSKAFYKTHKNWFERGHLAAKYLAERISQPAAKATHNLVNAVPQRSQFNKGSWFTLECFTGAWANKYGEVWVIAGPVFKNGKPAAWLRSDSNPNAMQVAIPHGIFKIVARKLPNNQWDALAFVYPQTHKSYKNKQHDPDIWLKSVNDIEHLTGEKFLSALPNAAQLKSQAAAKIWPVAETDFDQGCDKAKATVQ